MKILVTLFLTGLLSAQTASAGWVSGGGELVKDAGNPWFLKNTTTVKYCTGLVDHQNFSASQELIDQMVAEAFAYWKQEFAYANDELGTASNAHVATQMFRKVSCSKSPDIHFQFGILTSEQRDYLGDPTKYIGVAVRTDYNNLKGRGFIYISPDSGPDKFDQAEAISNPWGRGNGGLLHKILVHELGHVFGIPHMGASSGGFIMKPEVIQDYLLPYSAVWAQDKENLPSFFRPIPEGAGSSDINGQISICWDDSIPDEKSDKVDKLIEYFGAPPDTKCLQISVCSGAKAIRIYEQHGENEEYSLLGIAQMDTNYSHQFSKDHNDVVNIYVTKDQTLFPISSGSFRRIQGPGITSISYKAVYETIDGSVSRQANVRYRPTESLVLGGVLNGIHYPDITNIW